MQRVIVVGGGDVGCEVAYWLRMEHQKEVTVIEMAPRFMEHTVTSNRGMLIHYLGRAGVPLLDLHQGSGDHGSWARVERNLHPSVPNPYETWHPILPPNIENPLAPKIKEQNEIQELPGDLIVFASGSAVRPALHGPTERPPHSRSERHRGRGETRPRHGSGAGGRTPRARTLNCCPSPTWAAGPSWGCSAPTWAAGVSPSGRAPFHGYPGR